MKRLFAWLILIVLFIAAVIWTAVDWTIVAARRLAQ